MNLAWWLVAATAAKPVDAPISAVTVYSDRARVTRTASVEAGAHQVEFPLLLDSADASSVRVEASGAEVKRVDIVRVDAEVFPADEARKLLGELEKVDDALAQTRAEHDAHAQILSAIRRLVPAPATSEPLKPQPKLNASGWNAVLNFIEDWAGRMQSKVRGLDDRTVELQHQADELREKARILGGARRRAGYRVTASVAAEAGAKLTLTYEASGARWAPTYDIQLVPEKGRVEVSFAGLVTQQTGEDWSGVAMTLSTAVPAGTAVLPKLLTWKVGQKDRFMPTPVPAVEVLKPPPSAPPLPTSVRESDVLRDRLASISGKRQTLEFEDDAINGDLKKPSGQFVEMRKKMKARPQKEEAKADNDMDGIPDAADALPEPESPPPAPPAAAAKPAPVQQFAMVVAGSRHRGLEADEGGVSSSAPSAPPTVMSLSPPGGYVPPQLGAEVAASQAGGYALTYDALRPETVGNGKSARVALFSQSWPVSVERKLYPALTQDAFLVAELKSPSPEPLPGGQANLFVGADPSGVARLKLVSPQESFTLPLGIDRAVKPERNVKVVEAEKGLIGKDDSSEYDVTIEIANPYDVAIQTRIIDQWPVTDDKNVEVKLLKTEPYAIQDKVKGALEWRVPVAPHGKTTVAFNYSIRRPKSWLLHQ